MSNETEIEFGRIQFAGKDLPPQPAKYDKLAVGSKNNLLMCSIVAESNFVRAIRSILGGGARADIKATGGKIMRPGDKYASPVNPGDIFRTDELYDCHTQKLEHGLVHALFITRIEGFMVSSTDEALWKELMDIRFTTPMLRDWLPYIRSELTSRELLIPARSFRCNCGVLNAKDEDIDKIVSEGLVARKILIP